MLTGWLRKKKPYHTWLVSYFAFVLLFVLFAFIMTMTAKGIVQEAVTKANVESFSTMNTIVHTLKNDLDSLGVRVSLDEEITTILEAVTPENRAWRYREIREALKSVSANYRDLEQIAVYDLKQGMLIDYDGANSMEQEYQHYLPAGALPEDAEFSQWQEFMQQNQVQCLYQLYEGDMMYLQSLPMGAKEPVAVLVCRVSAGELERKFPEVNWGQEREMLLLSGEKSIVYESQPPLLGDNARELLRQKEAGIHTLRQDGKKIVAYVSETEANLICVYALPASDFWLGLNAFLGLMVLLGVLLGILGILLANIFAKRQYTPVENILKLISSSAPASAPRADEFDYIQTTLKGILKSAKENERFKTKYQNISFRSAFVKYLREGGAEAQELLGQYGISFHYPYYMAALLSINDFSDYFGTIDFENENEQELMELAITNVFDEMLGGEYHTLDVRLDGNMLFCIIASQRQDMEEAKERITQAQEFTRDRVGIYYSVLLSEPFESLSQLRKAYSQTLDLYTWHHSGERDILAYEEVDWGEGSYDFSVEMEKHLLDSVLRGKQKEAVALLEQIFHQPQLQPGGASNLKWMKYDIMSAFMKMLRSDTVDRTVSADKELQKLENCMTLEELYQKSMALAKTLCQSQQAVQQSKETTLGEKVMHYVRENFSNIDLNVNKLGDVFHLSSSYLSKTFKQQTGEILRDYIMNIRLKHAEVLLQSDLKLEEVARQSGFIDAGTFIRAFKKRYGTTPGKYREQM